MTQKKKLIEVSLPLEVINRESAREKSIRHGHPSTMHIYWARRPLATARSILFAQLVDDPSSNPELFPTEELQDVERKRLHNLIEELANWDNLGNKELYSLANLEIRKSNGGVVPEILDPFAGGGAIPLEAQRLGLISNASDLNPLAVLLNKALIEFPPKFRDLIPVFPMAKGERSTWDGVAGLCEDIRLYGSVLRGIASTKLAEHYPSYISDSGTQSDVVGWIWARTVISPNPANPVEVPLVRSWWLSKKKGSEAYVKPTFVDGSVKYEVILGNDGPKDENDGTVSRAGGFSVSDGTPFTLKYIRDEAKAGRMGRHLIAVVLSTPNGRTYANPTPEQVTAANVSRPDNLPMGQVPLSQRTPNYGMTEWVDLFTNRQLLAISTLWDSLLELRTQIFDAAINAGLEPGSRLERGGSGAEAYADAVVTYLGLAVSRSADYNNALNTWISDLQAVRNLFARQRISMSWDYVESNIFSKSTGSLNGQIEWVAKAVATTPAGPQGFVISANAATRDYSGKVISTDPPYYDNIGYADLSDFFYVWLRRGLGEVFPETMSTMLTPKAEELVADSSRHGGKIQAEDFFVNGFNSVFSRIRQTANLSYPMTVYYAYKQQEESGDGKSSTGWHTLLDGLINSGWEITATWPVRSERAQRMVSIGANALASSIVLACRPRRADAEATTRRAFLQALKAELPEALRDMMQGSIAPVDLAQAAIGPGMGVFSRYSRVREADGSDMSVKEALLLINLSLDEVLSEQESDFDPGTRFAVKWYKQFGWTEGPSGIADQLARSSDTSIAALERGGAFEAKAGKAKLISPTGLASAKGWDPSTDDSISIWECVVRLAGIMHRDGAESVVKLLPAVEERVGLDAVKELGFLLFHEAEKKGDTKDAIMFNGLVGAWGDITQQARGLALPDPETTQQRFEFQED
jgi:putative DNA methylase